jgi:hypothetical protein
MSWNTKTKIVQQSEDVEIRTPDGQQILVGAAEDQVLLSQEAFNNWTNKTKIAA